LWRSSAQGIDSLPREGAKVSARGKLTVFEPRGRYQLVVSAFVADAGAGDLWQKFEALKQKLAAEGLFDPARKRQLPEQPKTVGIVTSRTGAALRDMLKILRRRAPGVTVVVAPTQVQGDSAGAEIVTAIRKLDAWGGADVLIVGRGGGSLEDLWAFNEEQVARAIVNCSIPVVSAVGHETDFTIADFVADARAATPSEAAECVAPDQALIAGRARHAALALVRSLAATIRERRHQLLRLAERGPLRRPLDMVMPKWQRLDDLRSRLDSTIEAKLNRLRNRADMAGAKLDGLSPLAVLSRGYSVTLGPDGKALTDALAVTAGDRLKVLLHRGKLDATVDTAENS
ncbi:MAG: exodeoxyribonuclease VII large subunit, partial [Planctomycetes bacterium]|nr:exodeoxyribonuclease VII large subunit [Planctomycetota bacterium]